MLSELVERHVALHLATGYLFRKQTILLRDYARFAETKGERLVRAATALDWAARGPSAGTRHGRLEVIRRFARLMHAEDARHEIPPSGVFGGPAPRRTPYIFTPKETRALLNAAGKLGPRGSLRPKMFTTMLGRVLPARVRESQAS